MQTDVESNFYIFLLREQKIIHEKEQELKNAKLQKEIDELKEELKIK